MEEIRGKPSKGKNSCQQERSEIAVLKSHSRQGTSSSENATRMLVETKRFPPHTHLFSLVVSASEKKCVLVTWEREHRTIDVKYLNVDLIWLKWLKIRAASGCRS